MRAVYLASDHAGFRLKTFLAKLLREREYDVIDCGPAELTPGDDYPKFGAAACKLVATHDARGILVCDTGIGMSIVANRFPAIRAALVCNKFMAERSRLHNNANVLCLGQEEVSEAAAEDLVLAWLRTDFSGEARHVRRLEEIDAVTAELHEEEA